jgi:cephalosporin-C deacetylase
MAWFDLPLAQLREYRTDTAEPPGPDQWWKLRLEEARVAARKAILTRHEADIYAPVEVFDTEFSGAGGGAPPPPGTTRTSRLRARRTPR